MKRLPLAIVGCTSLILLAGCKDRTPARVHPSSVEVTKKFYEGWKAQSGATLAERLQKSGSGTITNAFRDKMTVAIAKMKPADQDPVFCFRDVPVSFEYERLPTISDGKLRITVRVKETFPLITLANDVTLWIDGGDWKIDAIACKGDVTKLQTPSSSAAKKK